MALLLAFFRRRAPLLARLIRSHIPDGIGAAGLPALVDSALATALGGLDWPADLLPGLADRLAADHAAGIRAGLESVRAALVAQPGAVQPTRGAPFAIGSAPHPASPESAGPGLILPAPGLSGEEIDRQSLAWADRHAAALVRRIEENTRAMIRAHVLDALSAGADAEALSDALLRSPGFDEARATRIARTELANARNGGRLAAYAAAGIWGKRWLVDGNPCPVCIANEAAGAIPLAALFPGGVAAPTQHPNCMCEVAPVIARPTRH